MSHDLYNRWWITSKKQLENLMVQDKIAQMLAKPIKDRSVASELVSGLYARYLTAVQDLALCLEQTCLVQKRSTMKKLVDSAAVRLNELKEELTRIDMSEYHYIDGKLIELKFIPHDIEIVDCNLIFERDAKIEDLYTKIKNRERIYGSPPSKLSIETQTSNHLNRSNVSFRGEVRDEGERPMPTEEERAPAPEEERERKKPKRRRTPQKFVPPQTFLSPEEIAALQQAQVRSTAVTIIQSHERARQCRIYYGDLDMRRTLRQRVTKGPPILPDAPLEVQTEAAVTIQKMWRGVADRNYLKNREIDRRLLIGMTEPSWRSTAEKDKVKKTIEDRRALRDQHIREYIQANLDEKERVLRVIAPGLMEDIGEEIREWFKFWYNSIKNFDKYPDEESGGSILIVRGETMTPKQWLEEMERKRKEKLKKKDKGAEKAMLAKKKKEEAERKKREKEKKKREAAAAKKKKPGDFEFKFQNSVADELFQKGFNEYQEIWDKRPFSENKEQKHYMDMITEEKCYEMQLEVRPQVDELMRIELNLLNEALENDKRKGKKGRKGKGKKGKGKKKKGKKGKKDLTGHRTIEDLFQELVDNGIIHPYPEAHLNEYIGDFSYSNWDMRNLDFDPPATLGDVRQAVMLNCILPLGAESMVKPKSVLIAGHSQSGKHLLANAVFNETQSVLFDLSPRILAGKYPGAKGMKMLLHLIGKMSRILQPSIIFIDGGEKPFYKKVPVPEIALEPRRIGKKLFKGIVKPITPEDKVLVLAITGQPFAAKVRQMNKAFEKIILIPRTDYGSLYMYWRELLMPFHGLDRNFNVSELAKLSVNYPLPAIKEAVDTVLTPTRLIQLKFKPLDAHELLNILLINFDPVEEKEWNKFYKWFSKTPLAKKRGAYIQFAEEQRQAEAKAAEKAKEKSKK